MFDGGRHLVAVGLPSPELLPSSSLLEDAATLLERPVDVAPVHIRNRREWIYRRLLISADALASLVVILSAALLSDSTLGWVFPLVPCFAVFVAKIQGLYDRDDQVILKSTLSEWRSVMQAAMMTGICTYVAWHALSNSPQVHRLRLLAFLVVGNFVVTVSARVLARTIAVRVAPVERCAIVGSPEECEPLARDLAGNRGIEVIGVISNSGFSASVADVRHLVESLGIQRMVIGPYAPWREGHILELVRTLKWLGVRVTLVPSIMAVVGGATVVDEMNGQVLLGVPAFGMSRSSAALKRAFDLILASIISVIVIVPALVLALLIKLDSRGPVIFRQSRVGLGGRPFTMYKFRSMVVNAEQLKANLAERNQATNGLFKMDQDPRVTRVGRLIRRTYLDELPQLINILRGEMSLVGPRPLIRSEDILLTGSDRHRLVLVPGMTGPWQLRGPLDASLPELAKLDYLYASNWSIWRDVDIILGTVVRVLRRHGH